MALDFLNGGQLDRALNSTYIVLIPKIKNPMDVGDYRPISLCNALYKIIAKPLPNRLKTVLAEVISYNQSAFILGRIIFDNVMIAYDTLHTMKNRQKGQEGSMAVKLHV